MLWFSVNLRVLSPDSCTKSLQTHSTKIHQLQWEILTVQGMRLHYWTVPLIPDLTLVIIQWVIELELSVTTIQVSDFVLFYCAFVYCYLNGIYRNSFCAFFFNSFPYGIGSLSIVEGCKVASWCVDITFCCLFSLKKIPNPDTLFWYLINHDNERQAFDNNLCLNDNSGLTKWEFESYFFIVRY